MSYNQNFYNNFHGNTFQNAPQFLPPPPAPPAYLIPPQPPWNINTHDASIVKQYESMLPREEKPKPNPLSITAIRKEIFNLLQNLMNLKVKERTLSETVNDLSGEEWRLKILQIEQIKSTINRILSNIDQLDLDDIKKLVDKRSAKRARIRRLRSERKKEKDEWIKKMKEKSRHIDEKLQQIQDDIRKAKQEEESKIQADIVLKETLRKKHDAKRFVVKLDALMKLRRARQNTAKGRGESVSEIEADTFNNNIEKLKTLWKQRLSIYEKEEGELRSKLEVASEDTGKAEADGAQNLNQWKDIMFGGAMPQVDFAGDVARFISVRCQWDEFVSCGEGASVPVGWAVPSGAFV